jgi:hypothetical protein
MYLLDHVEDLLVSVEPNVMVGNCHRLKQVMAITVGAQSIAPAQSIAHSQIGDSISQKN